MDIGLRIDVDTLRGTRIGVPNLVRDLGERNILGSFFFSVGPDNMGRHLFRLLKPKFAYKMLRSKAASLYGWDILLRGTLGQGPIISNQCANIIKQTAEAKHEIGLHAWDHHQWQSKIDKLDQQTILDIINRGSHAIKQITGQLPTCFASPGWRSNNTVIQAQSQTNFTYTSDCRGSHPFQPTVNNQPLGPPQVPATLPTYDELVGQNDITPKRFVEIILEQIQTQSTPVLTIHAEVEGIIARDTLVAMLDGIEKLNCQLVPLSKLLPNNADLPQSEIKSQQIPGREGLVAVQATS